MRRWTLNTTPPVSPRATWAGLGYEPNRAAGDATIDTHAIAAALLHPLGGGDKMVEQGLGMQGASDAATGSKGLYGLYAEAYRKAAEARGVLPRQMQSVTWEAVRGLFSPEEKRNAAIVAKVRAIWEGYHRGEYNQHEAQRRILSSGITEHDWKRLNPQHHADTQSADDASHVHGARLAGRRSIGMGGRSY
jgi:hypothetical protein